MSETKKEFIANNGVKRTFYYREDTNDFNTILSVFEQDTYDFLDEDYIGGDVVIDLGAHVASFSMLASTIPSLRIIAVEPLPQNCTLIKKTINENNAKVSLYERIIWSDTGEIMPIFHGDSSFDGRAHEFVGQMNLQNNPVFIEDRKGVNVKTISLEEIFKREKIKECAFLKIDIEGAEFEVFESAPRSTLKKIRKICGECHDPARFKELFKYTKGVFNTRIIGKKDFILTRK